MTDEQKELLRRSEYGIATLKGWYQAMTAKDESSDMAAILSVVIEDYEKLLKDWSLAIGHPQKIKHETVLDILRTVTKITEERIRDKIF